MAQYRYGIGKNQVLLAGITGVPLVVYCANYLFAQASDN